MLPTTVFQTAQFLESFHCGHSSCVSGIPVEMHWLAVCLHAFACCTILGGHYVLHKTTCKLNLCYTSYHALCKKGFTSTFAVNIHPQKINSDLPITTTTNNILVAMGFSFFGLHGCGYRYIPFTICSILSQVYIVLYNLWNVMSSFLIVSCMDRDSYMRSKSSPDNSHKINLL